MRRMHFLTAVSCLVLGAASCLAQATNSFTTKSSPTSTPAANTLIYAVDVNNDGVPDLLQSSYTSSAQFVVSLANGDGTFRAPTTVYSFPSQYSGNTLLASGDFNGDGKVDVVFLGATNQLLVFLGNGNGTFQAPKTVTVPLPAGYTWFGSQPVAADFNLDGKLDLAAVASSGSSFSVYVLNGDGTGSFGAPKLAYSVAGAGSIGNVVAGDFDSDGKADLAFGVNTNCSQDSICNTALHVMYGGGNATFTDSTPYSNPYGFSYAAGDLNSDGITDIFGFSGDSTAELTTLYASTSRTFATYASSVGSYGYGHLQMGDFNGDGRMDLVAYNYQAGQVLFLLANTSLGSFTPQTTTLETTFQYATDPVVADFNADTKPDVALLAGQSTATILDLQNTTATGNWGGCAYVKLEEGINLCAPTGSSTSPVTFSASAYSFGQLRKMELWIDGKKLSEQHQTWEHNAYFNYAATLAAGSHKATIYSADIDDRLLSSSFTVNVGSGSSCTAPTSPGINICSPASGATVSSPVSVQALSDVTGTIARMEVWVDGVKKYTSATNTLQTSLTLAAGSHRFDFYAVNTAGTKIEKTIYATVH